MGKLYIAYGSNLNLSQMAARCPNATIYANGILKDWALVFHGSKRNAHATIVKRRGCSVPVLIWNIQPLDEYYLDIYEGYPEYYYKLTIPVEINGKVRNAMAYIMDDGKKPGIPSDTYVETIQEGYIENGLDMEVLEKALKENQIECR